MSKINKERRSLLQGATLAGAAASLPLSAGATVKPVLDKLQREEFPMPEFESFVNDSVTIRSAAGDRLVAKIESVEDMTFECAQHNRPGYLRECAKVVRFKVSDAEGLSSEIYHVKHSKLGKMDLLLTAVPNANGVYGLEAVFN